MSPYREVISPLIDYVHGRLSDLPDAPMTVVLPDVVPHAIWEEPLHNQLTMALNLALRRVPGVVVVTVPVRLRE